MLNNQLEENIRIFREMGLAFLYHPTQEMPSTAVITKDIPSHDQQQVYSEATFPEPFLFYLHKISDSVKVVWTYFELDQDFRGNPDPQRLELWYSIMKAKGLQQQHVAFWPIELHPWHSATISRSIDFFCKFVNKVCPKFIFCFGSAAHGLFHDHSNALSFNTSVPIIFLPGAEEMLPDNKSVKRKAWSLIRPLEI
ncbi:hypothetical protein SAMN05660653_00791 [Desulfonatronum thiosulfatophilum]|uniref:Uracil DNA glycosylase superfamily protein n=1 Tax=Desulfonatronum thiosulfatophilum TaxID=617002 RepID=A0A1G6B899_9BACT|nr:hypothetical protein [Desulfonatronum thiosulfatophilum]SDB16888.1 hypothetical protein SAMN05660653_00791 [Desulfonatronum thiosulfatophilum]